MVVFRCTQRVLRRFALTPSDDPTTSSGALGDWYANLLNYRAQRYVLCQSERSLLPVILPARKASFPAQFGGAMGRVLAALGIPGELVQKEIEATEDVQIAHTRSRQVLGAMNDFAFNAQVYLAHAQTADPALEAALKLAEMPSKPIGYDAPGRLALSLLCLPRGN